MTRAQAVFARLKELFICDTRGATAVLVAMTLPALLGLAALGAQVSLWYVAKRNMQGAADAAAYSAIMDYTAGGTSTYTAAAQAVAASFGYTNGSNGATVTVNRPPKSGNYTTNSTAIEVIVAAPAQNLLAKMFFASSTTLSSRAVAATVSTTTGGCSGGNCGCVLALDKGDVVDLSDSGGTTLTLNTCSLYINSDRVDALEMSGGATITAAAAFIAGNFTTSGGAKLNVSPSDIFTGVSPAPNPYAGVSVPSYSGCSGGTSVSVSGGKTANFAPPSGGGPLVFCNGFSLSGGSTANFAPGTYIINQGSFAISGGTTINATGGVTFVFTSSTGANFATASISGGAVVNITAPPTGPLAGLAFFQDPNAPSSGSDSFSGGATQNITGAIYFPDQTVNYSGGTATGGAQCTQLIANELVFSGGSTFSNNCTEVGTTPIGNGTTTTTTSLVE